MSRNIQIKNAYANNLKQVDLEIPKNQLVVLTGLSGSGKSSIAFDIIDNESRRQYMESLGLITDGVAKAKCDWVKSLPPSISIQQHLNNKNPRSTIGTVTELYTYIRLLFAKLGQKNGKNQGWSMAEFSFNKPDGACRHCTGLGVINQVDLDKLIDFEKSIPEEAIKEWDIHYIKRNSKVLANAARHYGYSFKLEHKIADYNEAARTLLLYGSASEQMQTLYPETSAPKTAKEGKFEGIITNLHRRYSEKANNKSGREKLEQYFHHMTCPDCQGMRLKESVRAVQLAQKSIIEVQSMSLKELKSWLEQLATRLNPEEWLVAEPLVLDLNSRLEKFLKVKVGYLSLIRSMPTLSNGEAQRLKIANLLSSGLSGVLYILDEPTRGLHGKDVEHLLAILEELKDQGNHLLLIEHDLSAIKKADYIIELGPGSGRLGGRIVTTGTIDEIKKAEESRTGQFLNNPLKITRSTSKAAEKHLLVEGITRHNVCKQTLNLPLNKMIGVAGVSGSGKSTIFIDVLAEELNRYYRDRNFAYRHCSAMKGIEHLSGIKVVNQQTVGRSSRSNPATYTKVYDQIRKAFAQTPKAVLSGLNASSFSFNSPSGQCATCKGTGQVVTRMHFLPDVKIVCPDCGGKRFKENILAVKINQLNIYQLLNLTIEEAAEAFKSEQKIYQKLKVLIEVGLGYLQLGQEFSTLSGGEMQRIKLAKDLIDEQTKGYLYIFDEASSGLHFADTKRLIALFQKIVARGNTVIVIEHKPQFLAACDHIIEIGPGSGNEGGQIIFEGRPDNLIKDCSSPTGAYLAQLL